MGRKEIISVEEDNTTEKERKREKRKKRKRKEGRREKRENEKKGKENEEKGRMTSCSPSIFRRSANQGVGIVHAPRGRGFLLLGLFLLKSHPMELDSTQ